MPATCRYRRTLRAPTNPLDRERYQTVYARAPGAVAAPTAGLHFDEPLLARLKVLGVEFGWLTLHVGAGTFQPVRSENLASHRMHAEYLKLAPALCDQVNAARAAGRRVVAVGTTVVRALESATGVGAGWRPSRARPISLYIPATASGPWMRC